MIYKNLTVNLALRADQVDFVYFLVSKERRRILREAPDALQNASSTHWVRQIDDLYRDFTRYATGNLADPT